VLLVEDDEETRRALCETLEDLGFRVEACSDGPGGLTQVSVKDFDLVLTDIRMPKMDGIELCQRLHGERPQLPVVVMTAYGDLQSALAALRAGAFDFISKPFSTEQLLAALERGLTSAGESSIVVRLATTPEADGAAGPEDAPEQPYPSLETIERRHIRLVLEALAWNKAEAARILGIDRATLYRKLRRYGIEG
jgi:DNA-binding NtrC family response regulator